MKTNDHHQSNGGGESGHGNGDGKIDLRQRRYPFTIVWTSVPILTWLCPWLGHLAIGKSDGHVYDFGRPYRVLRDSRQLGPVLKYWTLDPAKADGGVDGWDRAIDDANSLFCTKMTNLFWNNCHSHVSDALNRMQYDGRSDYTKWKLFWLFNKNFQYVSVWTRILTFLPSSLLILLIIIIWILCHFEIFCPFTI